MFKIDNLIERLYEEIYSPKLTPQELMKNVTLPNYISVNFNKNGEYLIGETKCTLPDGTLAEFIYTFDSEYKLLHLKSEIEGKIEYLYDREQEIKNKYSELREILNLSKTAEVI